jgi:hypothetical protein
MTGKTLRRSVLLFFALLVALIATLSLGVLLLGTLLNSPRFVPLAERTVRAFTGLSFQTSGIRFRYPLCLRLEEVVVSGDLGGVSLRIRVGQAEIRAGWKSMTRGFTDSVRIQDLDASLKIGGPAARPSARGERTLLEIPGWLWRMRKAEIRNIGLELSAGNAPLRMKGMDLLWSCDPGLSAGALTVSLRDPEDREDDLTIDVKQEGLFPRSSPVVLPDLDISALLAFAGVKLAASGTLTGALRPLSTDNGVEGFSVKLKTENLTLDGSGMPAGFEKGELSADLRVLFQPLRLKQALPTGGILLAADAQASLEGVQVRGTSPARESQPFQVRVHAEMNTGTGRASWQAEGNAGPRIVSFQGQGTAERVLTGDPPELKGSVSAACNDLPALLALLAPEIHFPQGLKWEGGVEMSTRLAGTPESMEVQGEVISRKLRVGTADRPSVPLDLHLLVDGRADRSGTREMELLTKRLRVGEIASIDLQGSYNPERLLWQARARSLDMKEASLLFSPFLPETLRGFEWGGTLSFSAHGQALPGKDGPLRSDFRAELRQGKFASEDSQRMGEGIDLDAGGTVSISAPERSVEVQLEGDVSGGEIVYEGLYANLTPLRPSLRLQGTILGQGARVHVRQSSLELSGIGTFRIRGSQEQKAGGTERRARVEALDVNLESVVKVSQEGGLGDRWPFFQTLSGSGNLGLDADLVQKGGVFAARGRLTLRRGAAAREQWGIAVNQVEADLPFSVGTAETLNSLPGSEAAAEAGGFFSTGPIDFRGIRIPELHARLQVLRDRVTLIDPLRVEMAGGRLEIPDLRLDGLTAGDRSGRVSLNLQDADLAVLTGGITGKPVQGRVNARLSRMGREKGKFFMESGSVQVAQGQGRISVEGMEVEYVPSGEMRGRLTATADAFPLETLTGAFLETPVAGTLDGSMTQGEIAGGSLSSQGKFLLSVWDGTVQVSGIRCQGIPGPRPTVEADLLIQHLDLSEMTAPLRFGRISGILYGVVQDLRIGPRFPYLQAFRMKLGTVKTGGVPQKIDARAVENMSRIGGSNALTAVLSSGIMRFFDEYYYSEIGVQGTLDKGWLELHGIPKDGNEYLIVRSLRLPTISMPLKILSPDSKIRFKSWVTTLRSLGKGN